MTSTGRTLAAGTDGRFIATHGARRTKAYNAWRGIMQRCHNPNAANYRYYGAKGIRVDPRWHTFAAFLADMGQPPFADPVLGAYELERRDPHTDYAPDNCEWLPKLHNIARMHAFKKLARYDQHGLPIGVISYAMEAPF